MKKFYFISVIIAALLLSSCSAHLRNIQRMQAYQWERYGVLDYNLSDLVNKKYSSQKKNCSITETSKQAKFHRKQMEKRRSRKHLGFKEKKLIDLFSHKKINKKSRRSGTAGTKKNRHARMRDGYIEVSNF